MEVQNGGVATDVKVDGGAVYVSSGGLLTGSVMIANGGINVSSGGTFLVDISKTAPKTKAIVSGVSRLGGTKNITVKVSDTQANGKYLLSYDAAGFNGSITVVGEDGTGLGTVNVNETVSIGGVDYSLAVSSRTLKLFIGTEVIPGDVYVNPEWEDLLDGSTVKLLSGGTATIGIDAFADIDDAVEVIDKDDGTIYIEGGTFAFTTAVSDMVVSSGADATLQSGTVIGNIDVAPGAHLTVSDGATVTVTEYGGAVDSEDGAAVTYKPNYISGFYVSGSGREATLHSGTTAGAATAYYCGKLRIYDGGIASNVSIYDYCSADIFTGGRVDSMYIASSGGAVIRSDAQVSSAYVYYTGSMTMMEGAQVETISAPYYAVLTLSGGTAGVLTAGSDTVFRVTLTPELNVSGSIDGALFYLADGQARGFRLNQYSTLDVMNGGLADRTVVSGYSAAVNIHEGGSGSKLSIGGSGSVNVLEGGLLQSATVNTSGYLNVSSGGRAESIVLNGNGWYHGNLNVLTGGLADGVVVSSGGYAMNYGDGVINGMTIMEGGQAYMHGSGSGVVVSSGGYLGIEANGAITGATVAAGGSMYTVDSGGIGSMFDTVIEEGGYAYNGGYASNTRVRAGGVMSCAYGFAEAPLVQSGGSVNLSGGTVSGIVLESGATVSTDYGILTGQITVEEGVTVSGEYLNVVFDLSTLEEPGTAPFVNNLSALNGPDMTMLYLFVPAELQVGTYLLAGGVDPGFGKPIEVYNTETWDYLGELTLNSSVRIGEFNYGLTLTDAVLAVSISVDPSDKAYANSEWADKKPGDVVIPVEGTTAKIGYDAFANVDDALDAVSEDGEVEVVGGDVSFDNVVTKPVTVDADATLSGKARFDASVTVNGAIAFDTAKATETTPQFTGFENVTFGDGVELSLNVDETGANRKFLLTDGISSGMDKATIGNPLFGRKVSVFGDEDYEIGSVYFAAADGVSYVLDLDRKGELALNNVAQRKENHENDELIVKATKQRNPGVTGENAPFTALSVEYPAIMVDPKGEVKADMTFSEGSTEKALTFYNYVNQADTIDYAQITLDHAAKLSFTVTATDKVKFTLFSISEKNGKWSQKSLKSASLSKAGTTKATSAVYLQAGTYYVAVENKNSKTQLGAYYNVELADIGKNSFIFADGDDQTPNSKLDNNWLYDKKTNMVNNRATGAAGAELFQVTEIKVDGPRKAQNVQIDDNTPTLADGNGYNNFVGFGDLTDFAKLSMDYPVKLNFTTFATDKVKLTVYSLTKGSKGWTLTTKLTQTLTLKKGAASGSTPASKDVFLDRLFAAGSSDPTGYYVSVTSTNKQGKAYYTVLVDSVVYKDADVSVVNESGNGWLYNKSGKTPNSNANLNLDANRNIVHMRQIALDHETYEGGNNFVGFGDEYDYAAFTVDQSGRYFFNIEATGKSKFTVYSMAPGKAPKALMSQTFSGATPEGGTKTKKAIQLNAGETYYVSMQATDAKKGVSAYYNVTALLEGASLSSALSMPETDSLASALTMPDSLSSGQYDANAFAGSGLDPASDKLLGESGNGLLASL